MCFLGRADRADSFFFFGLSYWKNGVALCSDGADCRWSRDKGERMTECQKLDFLATWNTSYLSDIHMEIHKRQLGRWVWNPRQKTWARYINLRLMWHTWQLELRNWMITKRVKIERKELQGLSSGSLWCVKFCSFFPEREGDPQVVAPSPLIQHRGLSSSGQGAIYFSSTSPSSQL